ncbi:MAG: DUF2085 domain-containing protein [Candidatus Altiarchaeota archaeon]
MSLLDRLREAVKRVEDSREIWSIAYLAVLIYAFSVIVITGVFFSAPYLVTSENSLLFGLGMLSYNHGYLLNNCHQLPQRSLSLNNIQLPVCSRDMGIYVGCLIGVLSAFKFRAKSKLLNSIWFAGALMTPLMVDGVSQTLLTMRESTNTIRFATGILFGLGMMYYVTVKTIHYAKRSEIDYMRVRGTSKMVFIVFTAVIVLLSITSSSWYLTREEAYQMVLKSYPGEKLEPHTYIPPNALNTVSRDPYLDSHRTDILDDLTHIKAVTEGGQWAFTGVYGRYYVSVNDGKVTVMTGY